ncbi:hypothetical protein BX661DRAFT_8830 [Kickxella alabastrina]|uniref:uncharacterized protein n=1 Tax=Kickxella alabastrina TaxID=61397 RepID=UPI00221ECB07|nr:uncharacterized protein BX661DRAFT_8830 [Kickxella alabastrina]KAI7834948.1 hypothetical protein BX661DRAFT_8830 [Kickxella alabastrina]
MFAPYPLPSLFFPLSFIPYIKPIFLARSCFYSKFIPGWLFNFCFFLSLLLPLSPLLAFFLPQQHSYCVSLLLTLFISCPFFIYNFCFTLVCDESKQIFTCLYLTYPRFNITITTNKPSRLSFLLSLIFIC